MQTGHVIHFRTIEELQESVEQQLEDFKKKADEYSTVIGEKIRAAEEGQSEELAELKEKLGGSTDPKKKQPSKKQNSAKRWKISRRAPTCTERCFS